MGTGDSSRSGIAGFYPVAKNNKNNMNNKKDVRAADVFKTKSLEQNNLNQR